MTKSHYYLKGYTVYLTKQASKVIGVPELHVDTDISPRFDQTRELWYVPYYINGELIKTFELSKEAVLAIEYQHGKEEVKHGDFFAQTGATGSYIKFDSTVGISPVVHHSEDRVATQITSPKHGSTVHHSKDGITMSVR